MKLITAVAACLSLLSNTGVADSNTSAPLSSHQILPDTFKPPQVFKNINLLRNINLEKGYVRETVNVLIENTDSKPQDEYFIPFKAGTIGNVGGLEVRDKKEPEKPAFRCEVVEYDPYRCVGYVWKQSLDRTKAMGPVQPNSTASPFPPLSLLQRN